MRVLLLALVALQSCGVSSWWFWSDDDGATTTTKAPPPEWNGLQVRFANTPWSGYFDLKRTEDEAQKDGYVKISECDSNSTTRGKRYQKNNGAVILIFDVNGYIAGIQAQLPNNQSNRYPSRGLRPPFNVDGDKYILNTYFTNPASICTTGRSASQFELEGTGSNLYIQNGSSPEASILIPRQQKDVNGTGFKLGKCFPVMGVHYWWQLTEDMICDTIFPVFLLYNGGKLNAFGWAFTTALTDSIFEHPTKDVFKFFMDPVPKCLIADDTVSTLHIYLTNNAAYNLC